MRIRRAMMAGTVLGGVGFGEEFGFQSMLKRTKASSRFSVNREFVPNGWGGDTEGT